MKEQAQALRGQQTGEAALSVVTGASAGGGGRASRKAKADAATAAGEQRAFIHTSMHVAEAQLLALRTEAFARVQAGSTKRLDVSAVLRDVIDYWVAAGCPPVTKP